jgi:type I restriction-modification system DNA methylase subunit
MSLYQTSVLKKHLNDLNSEIIDSKYKEFIEYFGNTEIQQNIRDSKEEEFQEGFIRELFVKIFGYTLKPNADYNIVLEKKNVDDSKKADGAILKDDHVVAVIELKSTQTTDLDNVETQAFGYKNHNPKCKYIITSNFEKIRIYIKDAIDHIEFDLFNLPKERFEVLWLYFSKENILTDIPLKIKDASVLQEEDITKKLYADYSKFRTEIFNNIIKNNTEHDKLILFKKTQKLLDRFLFIFFAEDRLLLPPNSISEIVKQWTTLYFGYLNTGFKGKKYDIFAYNGGLFAPDEVLDNIKIDDEILHLHTVQLSTYDFETDVDVNILGHIFEHSLGEIENVQAELAGEEVDIQKTKRKKDGIFYTPKYITKYIVDNTVGKLCAEKRSDIGIVDEEYAKGRRNRKKDIVKNLDNKLTQYRDWLLSLTILDPACGSGAFLNQALDFLINEHAKIDELKAQLLGGSIVFPDVESKILEKNIYGVDLNEESVEIAKLSLWLRTAQKGRKLTTLSDHIKCGNSLIDDPDVVGEKAFNWQKEFPAVFARDGFDVVIGNPPYVRAENINKNEREYYLSKESKYKYTFGRFDLYILFNELGISLLKKDGLLSYIFPSSFFNQNYSVKQREWFLNELDLLELIDLSEVDVFKGVAVQTAIIAVKNTVPSVYVTVSKPKSENQFLSLETNLIEKDVLRSLPNSTYRTDLNASTVQLINKIKNNSKVLNDFCYVVIGAVPHNSITGASKDRLIKSEKENERCKKYIEGKNVKRYLINWDNKYLDYQPAEMHRPKFPELFENDKLLVRNISTTEGLMCVYDDNQYYVNDTMSVVIPWCKLQGVNQRGVIGNSEQITLSEQNSLKFNLSIINSKLLNYYYKLILSSNLHVYPEAIRNLPLKPLSKDLQLPYIHHVENIILLKQELHDNQNKFITLLTNKFNIEKISNKIRDWYLIDFKEFLKELKKNKIQLSLTDESEWIQYFTEQKQKMLEIINKINHSDNEIDQMVYELYGLTEEEINIIKES